ncbi:MAG: arabinofuranosyltransferase, partial [Planctomycetota bacterium]
PVEGYSNFLWVALLSVARTLGCELEIASRVLSIGASVVLVLLLHRSLVARGFSRTATTLGTLALVTFPPFATWATGGLETALFALLFFVAFDALIAPPATRRSLVPLLIAGLALPLVRTDGLAFIAVLAITTALVRSHGSQRRLPPFVAAALLSATAYGIWRYTHYGLWVANTVRVKAGFSSELLLRGVNTSASYLLVLGSPLLALAGVIWLRASPARACTRHYCLAATLGFAAFLAYNTLIGGDWMPMFRMLAPASPLLAIVIAGLVDRAGKVGGIAIGSLAIGVAILPSFDLSVASAGVRERLAFRSFKTGYQSERARWQRGVDNLTNFTQIGKGLAQVAPEDASFTAGAIGAIGYYSGLQILDRNGLVEPSVATLRASPESRSAGHDKRVPRAFFLDRSPTYFEAVISPQRIPGPNSPAFSQAASYIGRLVLTEPGEAILRDHCLPQAHALQPEPGLPEGCSLLVLRATEDSERARQAWERIGL